MPKVGWGIANPDEELSIETLALLAQLASLSEGQRDAILVRGFGRFLECEMELTDDPTRSDMVNCSAAISNLWYDFLGRP
jgi:hypothetical protein